MTGEQSSEVTIIESRPLAVKLTDVAIETIRHNIMQSEKLVFHVLEKDVDYGRLPGIPQEGLWDPGASKIINAFNSYPDYKVLHQVEEDNLISYTMQSVLINRETQMVVGTGIGAASTREPKYKYRWVLDPQNYGYSPEEIKTFKVKDNKYRIPNPEYGELVNTMVKMAAKRADVDAAQSLPGVGSALRKLFGGISPSLQRKEPDWDGFWGRINQIGITKDRVHELLGVTSTKEWIAQGKTLDDAIKTIASKLAAPPAKGKGPPPPQKRRKADDIKPGDITDGYALEKVAFEVWGLQPKIIWDELNYTSVKNFEEAKVEKPWDCFLKLKMVRETVPGGEPQQSPDSDLWG